MTAVPLPRSMEVLEDEKRLSFFPVKDITKNLAKEFETPRVKSMISRLSQDVYINGSEYMKVYVRVRPLSDEEVKSNEDQNCIELGENSHTLALHPPKDSCKYRASIRGSGAATSTYSFTKVFSPVTGQKDFFESTALKVVDDFIKGQNALIFTYGVTSSGKTFTMQGKPGNEGIMPRSIDVIFNSIGDHVAKDSNLHLRMANDVTVIGEAQKAKLQRRKDEVLAFADPSSQMEIRCDHQDSLDQVSVASASSSCGELSTTNNSTMEETKRTSKRSSFLEFVENQADDSFVDVSSLGPVKFVIFVSFIEIYKEYIYDLLRPMSKGKNARRPALRLGEHKGLPFVKDLSEIQIHSREEMYKLLTIGQNHLHMAETNLNHNSSRSHCIFSIKIVCTKDLDKPSTVRVSQLSFCDLAGSERWGKTSSFGERLKEAGKINTSMLTLGKCIEALRYNQQHRNRNPKVVPFRESRLTRLFQSILQGHGRACMIVNVNQRASMFDETAHALKFSAIASEITVTDKPFRQSRVSRASSRSSSDDPASPVKQKRVTIGWEPAATPIKEQDEDAEDENADSKTTTPDVESSEEEEEYTYDDWKEREGRLLKAIEILRQALREEKESNLFTERKVREECMEEMKNQFVSCKEDYEERLERVENQGEQKYESSVALANGIITRIHNEKLALEKDNEKLDEECEELENKLDAATDEIKDLKAEVASLKEQQAKKGAVFIGESSENEKEETPSTPKDQSEMFQNLQKEYEDGREIIQEQFVAIKSISESLEEKTDENEKLITKCTSLESDVAEHKSNVDKLTEELQKRNEDIEQLKLDVVACTSKAQLHENKLKATEAELEAVTSELEQLNEKVKHKQSESTKSRDEMMTLQSQLEAANRDLEISESNATAALEKVAQVEDAAEKERKMMEEEILSLKSEGDTKCTSLESDVAEHKSNVDKLTEELQKRNEDIEQLKLDVVACTSKAQLHENKLKATEAELEAVTSELEQLNEKAKHKQSESTKSRDEMMTLQSQLEAANRDLEISESNATAALEKVAQVEDAAEKERKMMEEEILNLKSEGDTFNSKAHELTVTLEEAILCGEMKTAEVEKLKTKITEIEMEGKKNQRCMERIEKERDDVKIDLMKEQEKKANLEQKLSEKEKQIENMSYEKSLEEANFQKKYDNEVKTLEHTHEKTIKDLKKAHTKEVANLESNLRSLNDELEESRKDSNIASTLEKQLMAEIDRLQSQANKLESDRNIKKESLQRESQASNLAQDINILTHERNDLLKTVEKLTQDLSKVSKEKQDLKTENQHAVGISVGEASELEKLRETLKEMDKLQEAQHQAIEKYETRQKENDMEIVTLKEVVEATSKENERKANDISDAMTARDKAEVERSNLAHALTSLEHDVAELKEQLNEKDKETTTILKKVEEKNSEIKLLQDNIQTSIESKEKELKKFREARDRISSALEGRINSQQACNDALKVKLETQIEANVKLRSENSALTAQLQLAPQPPISLNGASVVLTPLKQEFVPGIISALKHEQSSIKSDDPEQTPTNSPEKASAMVNMSTGMMDSPLPIIKQEEKNNDSNDENTPPSEDSQHSDDDSQRQARRGRGRRATKSTSRQAVVKKVSSRRKRGGAAIRPATPIPEGTQSNDSSPPVRRRRTTRATSSNEVILKSETSSAAETDENDATLINQVLDGLDLVRATGNSQQFPKSEMEIDVTPQLKKTRRGKRTKNNEATESSVDPPSLSKTRSRRRGKPVGLEAAISIDEEGKSKVNVARMGNILKNSPVGQAFKRIEAAISPSRSPVTISRPTALNYNDQQRQSTRRVRKLHADDISLPLQSTPDEHSAVGSISGRVGLLSQTQNVASEMTRKLRRRK